MLIVLQIQHQPSPKVCKTNLLHGMPSSCAKYCVIAVPRKNMQMEMHYGLQRLSNIAQVVTLSFYTHLKGSAYLHAQGAARGCRNVLLVLDFRIGL
jgi:hypothetical protein